ncbi:MAG: sugar phosphate isomerase/epimerase family protein [Armatimonadota bacterium]
MNVGVNAYCFNRELVAGEMTMFDVAKFVGGKTEAQAFEPLVRYWDRERGAIEQAEKMGELVEDLGMFVACYTLDSNFGVPDAEARQVCVDRCKRELGTAKILGTDIVRLDPCTTLPEGEFDSIGSDALLQRICDSMVEVVDAAAEMDITIAIENHGRLVGRSEQVAQMVQLIDRPNFGVNIDFTNFSAVFGEDHHEATALLAADVKHAHAKDYDYRESDPGEEGFRELGTGIWVRPAAVGDGDADYNRLLRTVADAGFDGTVCVETPGPADPKDGVRTGVANLRRIMEELGVASG